MIRTYAQSIQSAFWLGSLSVAAGFGFSLTSTAAETVDSHLKPIEDVLEVQFVATWEAVDDDSRPIDGKYIGSAHIRYREEGIRSGLGQERQSRRGVEGRFVKIGHELRAPYNEAPYFGKVVGFDSDGVRIQWGEEVLVLRAPEMPDTNRASGSHTSIPVQRDSYRVGEQSWFIGTDEVERIITNHESMMGDIDVEDAPATGVEMERAALSLVSVPEKSLAYQRGFRGGDVLRTVNGQAIQSTAWATRYFKANSRTKSFTFEIDRAGELVWITFTVAR